MPKNGKLSAKKSKGKSKGKSDNLDKSTTKSKSISKSQSNVNVSVSIVKNQRTNRKPKSELRSEVKPLSQPPQNIYYQQLPNSDGRFSELTNLLRDMNKELFAQRNIVASTQPVTINPYRQEEKRLISPIKNNIFEDEPFEEHFRTQPIPPTPANSTTSSNSSVTHLKVVDDTPEEKYRPQYNKLLVEPVARQDYLSEQPNPFESRRLYDEFGMPLQDEEQPQELIITERKRKLNRFIKPKQIAERPVEPSTSDFTEPVEEPVEAKNVVGIESVFTNKTELRRSTKQEKINEIQRLEETYGINLNYAPNMTASEIFALLDPYVKDGKKKR